MATHTVNQSVSINNITYGATAAPTYTGTGYALIDGETVATASTDTLINISFPYASVKSFFLMSTAAITVETNATDHAGGDTITLVANVPYIWTTDSYNTFKITANVTKFYITNASGATATIYCSVVHDSTP